MRLHERNWTMIRDKYHVIDLSAEYTYSNKIQFTVDHGSEYEKGGARITREPCEHVAFTIYQIRSIYGVENFFSENYAHQRTDLTHIQMMGYMYSQRCKNVIK